MATLREIAKECGVSMSTVSKALNGYTDISESTRERILAVAESMNYLQAISPQRVRVSASERS